jgi:hypothetical protein
MSFHLRAHYRVTCPGYGAMRRNQKSYRMPNYILHIGLPKTGTKYLQAHFRRHRDILATAGVHYPANWWASKYDINHDGLAKDIIAKNDARLTRIFAEFEASECRTVLLSCEGFSDLDEASLAYLQSLIGTAQVQVVFFCRRWSDWIPSAWQQTVKQGSNRTFPEFLTGVISEARLIPTINFRIILDAYAKVFGRETIAIVPYSNLLDEGLDLVEVFYRDFLGFEQMPEITREAIHPSIGIHIAEVVRALNALSIRAQGASDVSTFQRMEIFQDDEMIGGPLGRIVAATKDSVGQIEVGDFDEPFNSLFQELTRDFEDLVLDVGCGTQLFQPRKAPGHFVRQDYLLTPGVVEDILLLHARLTSIGDAEQSAKAETMAFTLRADPSWHFDMQVMQGEAAVDYLAAHPLVPDPSGNDRAAFLCDLKAGSVPPWMLGEGWSSPETNGTWTDGKRALLKLPRAAVGGTHRLRLILRPFVAPPRLAAQGFTLSVNGETVGRNKISQFAVIQVDLPWVLLENALEVTVALDMPDAGRPCDLTGHPDDARQLALYVQHVSIWPQIRTNTRYNESKKILTSHEVRRLFPLLARHRTAEDQKLFNAIQWALAKTGAPSINGSEIAKIAGIDLSTDLPEHLAEEKMIGCAVLAIQGVDDTELFQALLPAEVTGEYMFVAQGNGGEIIGQGWAGPEAGFTWTNGGQATLRLPKPAIPAHYFLRIQCTPYIVRDLIPSQRVLISADGREIGAVKLKEFAIIDCDFPWEALAGGDPILELTLDLPDAKQPLELGLSDDDRSLGLAVESVSLVRLSPASEPELQEVIKPDEVALDTLMLKFESLGENCEFGLAQRRCGAEPLGLFRFSSAPLPKLLNAFRSKFKGMGGANSIAVQESSNGSEYMVLDKRFGFLFHAWVLVGERSPEEVKLREMRRIPFLVRKLTEEMMLGEKTFVYHGMETVTLDQARDLSAALREFGPATLLWVELADEEHAAGTVEMIEPGLLKGYMDRFAPGENAHDLSLEGWIALCRNVERHRTAA